MVTELPSMSCVKTLAVFLSLMVVMMPVIAAMMRVAPTTYINIVTVLKGSSRMTTPRRIAQTARRSGIHHLPPSFFERIELTRLTMPYKIMMLPKNMVMRRLCL